MFRSDYEKPFLKVTEAQTKAIKVVLSNKSSQKPQSQIVAENKRRISVLF